MKSPPILNSVRKVGRSALLMLASVGCTCFLFAATAGALTIAKGEGSLRLEGVITEESPRTFSARLAELLLEMQERGDKSTSIRLHLDIPKGGLASASFRMARLMKIAQSHGTTFSAHVGGRATCMSGCTYLFLAANERWVAPDGKLIFHGFNRLGRDDQAEIPTEYFEAYYNLLKSANESFFSFFKAARIIEENRTVGFTGRTLFEHKAFSGLITGLEN